MTTILNVARVGVREDLSDRIAELFPDDTPFQRAIGTSSINNTYTEWQTDSLVAANASNASIQGADLATETRPNTTRVGTHSQIFTKRVGVSTTVEWTNKAGRKSEMARETMKMGKEIRIDMEARFLGNFASVAATGVAAGQTAGALAWLTSNVSRGGGSSGGFSAGIVAAATNGTLRTYSEAQLKSVVQSAWTNGGNPTMVFTNGILKQAAAAFPGLADQRRETGNNRLTIVAGADIYVSDFGELQFVPDRFASTRDALVVDTEFWEVGIGRALQVEPLAKNGLADRRMMSAEVALICRNQAASAVVADIQP